MRVRHPQFPARGRKQLGIGFRLARLNPSVRHPQFPARGRKHSSIKTSDSRRPLSVRHPQFPARGRKPKGRWDNDYDCRQTPSIPRKGTETNDENPDDRPDGLRRQTPSIPRKGTETFDRKVLYLIPGRRSDTLNSPQGDGNPGCQARVVSHFHVRHPQFPARGRKLQHEAQLSPPSIPSDTLNSPQGDGNRVAPQSSAPPPQCQTPSIPRKGTETLGCGLPLLHPKGSSDTLNSPQGDGNV